MSEEASAPEGTAPEPARSESPSPAEPIAPEISFDQFVAVDLRVGPVVEAAVHPDADRLLVLKVDIGEETPRQIVAGIRADWTPEAILGRKIIVVANLAPRKMRGVESRGMLLAVRGDERVVPVGVEGAVTPGTRVS